MCPFNVPRIEGIEELTPVFQLPNCVLFPGGLLPLHVFEPRYRTMVRHLMVRPPGKRFLAIAQLCHGHEEFYQSNQGPIQQVVGLGEIIQHVGLADGCCHILTVGRARARVICDDASGVYHRAKLELLPTEPSNLLAVVHHAVEHVRTLLAEIAELELYSRDRVQQILKVAPTAAALIDIAAYHLMGPGEAAIKQRILEEERLEVRAEILACHLRKMIDTWHAAQFHSHACEPWLSRVRLN